MQRLLARLDVLRAATVFPARVRLVVQADLAVRVGATGEWLGADAAETIAAAAGIAVAEQARGGVVVAVVRPDAVAAAVTTARALGAPFLVAVAGDDLTPYVSAGFARISADQALPKDRFAVCTIVAPPAPPARPRGREWPPVHLPTLRAWQRLAYADLDTALAALAVHEERLCLVSARAPWSSAPASPGALIAAAAYAGEGRRMIYRIPAGVDLLGWLPALRAIGQRRLAMTLLLDPGVAPALAHWRALPGWWVAAPADPGELVAVLARAVASEDAVAVLLPAPAAAIPVWPIGDEHEPGAARTFGAPAGVTIVCAADSTAAALAAQAALATLGLAAGVLQCTSLQPMPEGELIAAAARGPLVVVDARDGAVGLAAAVAAALPGVATNPIGGWRGLPPGAADIAAAVRTVLDR